MGFIAQTHTKQTCLKEVTVYVHFSERIIETSDNSVPEKTAGEIRDITS